MNLPATNCQSSAPSFSLPGQLAPTQNATKPLALPQALLSTQSFQLISLAVSTGGWLTGRSCHDKVSLLPRRGSTKLIGLSHLFAEEMKSFPKALWWSYGRHSTAATTRKLGFCLSVTCQVAIVESPSKVSRKSNTDAASAAALINVPGCQAGRARLWA